VQRFGKCLNFWSSFEQEQSLWNYLFNYLNVPDELRILAKPVLKKTVYAMCYGMERPRLKGQSAYWLACEGLDKTLFRHLQDSPLILALLNARDNALQTIAANGGGENCYCQWEALTEERQPRDIMAAIAQAWEMKLVYPVFEVAQRTHDFKITLFQHDGFVIHFTQRQELGMRRIEQAVNDNARRYGVSNSPRMELIKFGRGYYAKACYIYLTLENVIIL